MRRLGFIALWALVALTYSPQAHASQHCSYHGPGKVRNVTVKHLTCSGSVKLIDSIRSSGAWRDAYYDYEDQEWVGYYTGGYDENNYLNEHQFECTYAYRGLVGKYVLVWCSDHRGAKVTARFYGR